MDKVNLREKILFNDLWSPKIVGERNDSYVKLAKFKGEFLWHHHAIGEELAGATFFCAVDAHRLQPMGRACGNRRNLGSLAYSWRFFSASNTATIQFRGIHEFVVYATLAGVMIG